MQIISPIRFPDHLTNSLVVYLVTGAHALPVWSALNLVPTQASASANYWCTWYSQNYWIGRGGDLDSLRGVANQAAWVKLDEATLFHEEDGWATTYLLEE